MNTATETTEELVNRKYKYGFVTDIETDTVPRGLNKDIVRLISAKKKRAWLYARLASQGLPALGQVGRVAGRARMGQRPLSADRLPRPHLLLGAKDKRGAEEPRRGLRASRSMRSSTACPWRRRSRKNSRSWGSSFVPFPRRCRSIQCS